MDLFHPTSSETFSLGWFSCLAKLTYITELSLLCIVLQMFYVLNQNENSLWAMSWVFSSTVLGIVDAH